MDELIEAIRQAFAWLKNIVKRIINGIISFLGHIVNWFRGLALNPQRHSPFLMNANLPQIQQMIKEAPVKKVGIFKGVYDEVTDEIIHGELLSADAVDAQTKEVMANEPIVVLS